jgi:hypothetical protein
VRPEVADVVVGEYVERMTRFAARPVLFLGAPLNVGERVDDADHFPGFDDPFWVVGSTPHGASELDLPSQHSLAPKDLRELAKVVEVELVDGASVAVILGAIELPLTRRLWMITVHVAARALGATIGTYAERGPARCAL